MDKKYNLDDISMMDGNELKILMNEHGIRHKESVLSFPYLDEIDKNPDIYNPVEYTIKLEEFIYDRQESLLIDLITNKILCIKGLYDKGLFDVNGKYYEYFQNSITYIMKELMSIPDFDNFGENTINYFCNFYCMYNQLFLLEKNNKFKHVMISLSHDSNNLNIPSLEQYHSDEINQEFQEYDKRWNNLIESNVRFIYEAKDLSSCLKIGSNFCQSPIMFIGYLYNTKTLVLGYDNNI